MSDDQQHFSSAEPVNNIVNNFKQIFVQNSNQTLNQNQLLNKAGPYSVFFSDFSHSLPIFKL